MMDCVLSGSLLIVFSLFCYAVCFFEQINSLSLSLVSSPAPLLKFSEMSPFLPRTLQYAPHLCLC